MTVADLMAAARQFRPAIRFAQQGSGAQAFLTSLEGVGADPAGVRYWQYRVNDAPANDSFGIHAVNEGDRVEWRYASGEKTESFRSPPLDEEG